MKLEFKPEESAKAHQEWIKEFAKAALFDRATSAEETRTLGIVPWDAAIRWANARLAQILEEAQTVHTSKLKNDKGLRSWVTGSRLPRHTHRAKLVNIEKVGE